MPLYALSYPHPLSCYSATLDASRHEDVKIETARDVEQSFKMFEKVKNFLNLVKNIFFNQCKDKSN